MNLFFTPSLRANNMSAAIQKNLRKQIKISSHKDPQSTQSFINYSAFPAKSPRPLREEKNVSRACHEGAKDAIVSYKGHRGVTRTK